MRGEPSDYFVFRNGDIWSKKNKRVLKGGFDQDGYHLYKLYDRNCKYITVKGHRAVAEAFIPNPNNYPEVNHKDGNKSNNNVSNLEWNTSAMNTAHATEHKLRKNGILNEKIVRKICKDLEKGTIRATDIANKYGVPTSSVIKIKNGSNWKHISCEYDFSKYKFNNGRRGVKNQNTKINEKTAKKIKKLLKEGKLTVKQIAEKVGVSVGIVSHIKYGKTWTYIKI